jgi:glyceraldehyde 3-phosphate dehydrogenase
MNDGEKVVLGICGFGRIGRMMFRAAVEKFNQQVQVNAINDPFMKPSMMCYLLSHDSVHGRPNFEIGEFGEDFITVNGNP